MLMMVDRISALPDDLLRHILSFLPTKLTYTTSVLSKRWTPLCHSLPALRFDDEGAKDKETYLRFRHVVDTFMLSPHHSIKTFSLMSRTKLCDHRNNPFNVDEWVEAAKRRRVENLQLSTTWILALSPNVFTSQTLVVLKLSQLTVEHVVQSVDLPSLTTLHLIETVFRNSSDVKKLLSGCPILVDLYAVVETLGYTTGYKTLPNLVKARIRAFDVPFSALYNVEFLRIEQMECRNIDKYIDSYYREMPVFLNLIKLELCFKCFSGWNGVVEVLFFFPKLQSLVIEKVSAYILQNARLLKVMTLHIPTNAEASEKDISFIDLSWCSRISPACKIECK